MHIAAGEPAYRGGYAGRHDLQVVHHMFRQIVGGFAVGEERVAAAEGTEHHVVCQVHVADEAHAEPVFRNERKGNAFPPDFQRIFAKQLIPASVIFNIADGTGFCRLQAGDRLEELLLAAAGDTRNS